jgi:hypothetical protein
MHKTMAEPNPETPDPRDVALEQAVAICDGEVRAALCAALICELDRRRRALGVEQLLVIDDDIAAPAIDEIRPTLPVAFS